ncbi:hypothetical protein [Falsihalocynthiibacter sp. CO-5D18]|uniref:hypothetical protein n=1 Tax=Falsihalocynthiibacter sp. CO-5D18 TaxID=3240872 RepID=UPI00350F37F3
MELPDRAYQRNVRVPSLLPHSNAPRKLSAKLSSGIARRAMLLDLAPEIMTALRSKHVEITRDEVIRAKKLGYLADQVAVLVDGSATRPVSSVQFSGRIIYADQPRNRTAVVNAAANALDILLQHSRQWRKSGRYMSGFEVRIDDAKIAPSGLLKYAKRSDWQRVSIVNTAPYAAKMERGSNDVFAFTYKALRKIGWTKRASIRYVLDAQENARTMAGAAIPRPRLDFQRLGEFQSRMTNRKEYQ